MNEHVTGPGPGILVTERCPTKDESLEGFVEVWDVDQNQWVKRTYYDFPNHPEWTDAQRAEIERRFPLWRPIMQTIKAPKPDSLKIEVYQQDWMPGFAAFLDDGSVQQGAPVHVALNVGALMAAVQAKDIAPEDLPYVIAESIMHEIIHALEAWAGVEFNHDRIDDLLDAYRQHYKDQPSSEDGIPP